MHKVHHEALSQAKEQGYLIAKNWAQNNAIHAQYRAFCKEEMRPLICVTRTGKSAHLEIDTDPVYDGGFLKGIHLCTPIDFGQTPELKERCKAIVTRASAAVHSGFSKRTEALSADDELFLLRSADPEVAIEIAKDLYAIWLEAKPLLPRIERRRRPEQEGAE